MNYCLTHEVMTEFPVGYADNTCVVVSCPPPAIPDNWVDLVTEPSLEELEIMDMNAQLLLGDLKCQ